MTLETPHVPLSWGELFDKTGILQIKLERSSDAEAARHVAMELRLLEPMIESALRADSGLAELAQALKKVNAELWDIENRIREKEAAKSFEAEFVALARSVYQTNDRRAALKRQINIRAGSRIVEQKDYSRY